MNSKHWSHIAVLIVALTLYLYFWQGWIAVATLYGVVVVALVCYGVVKARGKKAKPQQRSVVAHSEVRRDIMEQQISRRREQGETLRCLAICLEQRDESFVRLAERIMDWHLEYSRANGIYHSDLYDFILDKCKERLRSAEAEYLKRELRVTIEIIRSLMRKQSVEDVVQLVIDRKK